MLLLLFSDPPQYNLKAIAWVIVALLGALFALYVRYRLASDEVQVSMTEFICTSTFYYSGRVRIRQSSYAFTAHTVRRQARNRPADINVNLRGVSDEVEERTEAINMIKARIVEYERQQQ